MVSEIISSFRSLWLATVYLPVASATKEWEVGRTEINLKS